MAEVTTKRPKVVLVKKDAVDQAGVFLDSLPEKPREDFSLRAAVDRLREPIRAALSKGYSYEEVAELLAKQGITISPSTLKNYVPSGTRQSSKDKATNGSNGRKAKKADEEISASLEASLEELIELTPDSQSEPEPEESEESEPETLEPTAEEANEEATANQPRRRTRSTATKGSTAKTAAKTKPSGTKQTATNKPAAKGRSKTTTKK